MCYWRQLSVCFRYSASCEAFEQLKYKCSSWHLLIRVDPNLYCFQLWLPNMADAGRGEPSGWTSWILPENKSEIRVRLLCQIAPYDKSTGLEGQDYASSRAADVRLQSLPAWFITGVLWSTDKEDAEKHKNTKIWHRLKWHHCVEAPQPVWTPAMAPSNKIYVMNWAKSWQIWWLAIAEVD